MADEPFTHLTSRTERGVLVLRLGLAELHGDTPTEALLAELCRAVEGVEAPRVVLDCEQVTFITSMGIGALLRFRKEIRDRGGKLLLCCLSTHVAEVLYATKLAAIDSIIGLPFPVTSDVARAIDVLARPPA
jgi:anti-anti-sigma factor